jgi:hypothetical protein
LKDCIAKKQKICYSKTKTHFVNAAVNPEDIALAIDIADDAFSVVASRHRDPGLIP